MNVGRGDCLLRGNVPSSSVRGDPILVQPVAAAASVTKVIHHPLYCPFRTLPKLLYSVNTHSSSGSEKNNPSHQCEYSKELEI